MNEHYIKCKYCAQVCKLDSDHVENCVINWNDSSGLKACFSCGNPNSSYSKTQLELGFRARCINCVKNKIHSKYEPNIHLYKKLVGDSKNISMLNINKQLEYYVGEYNVEKVRELLIQGANPNYCRQASIYLNNFDRHVFIYDEFGNEIPESDNEFLQPINPLRLCIFYLSNMLNSYEDLKKIIEISKNLIKFGADKSDGLKYFRELYGNDVPSSKKFIEFYNILI